MRRWLIALALCLLPALASAQTRVPQWPADFDYLGSFTLPTPPSGNGDSKFAFGLAPRLVNGQLRLYTLSFNKQPIPQWVLEWRAPWNGTALTSSTGTFLRNLGPTGHPYWIEVRGLFWDEPAQRLYAVGASVYDGTPAIYPTLNRNRIDETTGKLVSEGLWAFDRRLYPYTASGTNTGSDKMMMGGVLAVPEAWRVTSTCGRLAGGFGGYESVVATGPAGMGQALACFDPPETGTTAPVIAKALIGFPFTMSPAQGKRGSRSIDYVNDVSNLGGMVGGLPMTTGENWPRTVSTAPGFWTWCDHIRQGLTWVYGGTISGLIGVEQISEGRCWYGSNDPAHPDGTAAALNSTRMAHQLRVIDPAELGFVAFGGRKQDSVQGTIQRLELPGITYPLKGLPTFTQLLAAITFEPVNRLVLMMVQDTRTLSSRPSVYVWRLRDAPLPFRPIALRIVLSTT